MKIEVIDEFLALVRNKGFNRAAKELYLSQSTLSAHIASLEKELEVSLIDRSAASFALTEAGKAFVAYAQDLSTLAVEAQKTVRAVSRQCSPVRIASRLYAFPAVLRVFKEAGVPVVPIERNIDQTSLDAIIARKMDMGCMLGVLDDALLKRAEQSFVSFAPLKGTHWALACSTDHPLASVNTPTRDDIRGATFLLGSLAWSSLEKHVLLTMLGSDLDLRFTLQPMENETELAFADLGDMLVSCDENALRKRYANRSDIVVINKLDGKPLIEPPALLAYRNDKNPPLTEKLIQAVAAAYNESA
ncbi:LysR family transcriptional regulator [Adlercreutzia sp. ZJ138]|uniref:LysR family transcriptional regulator n=1 Tax=Adlercreutzia sp. ZJ138 TaxID=2709405 RepID=UPI0013EDE9BB|nr:LysR family transcriptional regulator [Adlercreutzia sp. ZJ138]